MSAIVSELARRDSRAPTSWRRLLAQRGIDGVTLLVLPATIGIAALFIYPSIYGIVLAFSPATGGFLANYQRFFSDPYYSQTIAITLKIGLPATLINMAAAVPLAFHLSSMRRQRVLTAILVLPVTLGTVLVAQGLLGYLGPLGWLNRVLVGLHLVSEPIRLTHNYWGVMLSLIITGFPFVFLLMLSYVTGIDPALPKAAATLGAGGWARFQHIHLPLLASGFAMCFCLAFVQAFTVFPSAVLLGQPAGTTRVISIVAYHAAYEEYDYSMASAVALIMGAVQLIVISLVLATRGLVYRGPLSGGKG